MVGVRSVGDWIGDRFEIFDVHEGGMSLVYVVHDHLGKSGRTVVALKTLQDELLGHKISWCRSLRDDHGQAAVSGQVAGHAQPPAFPLRAPLDRSVHTSFSCAHGQQRRSACRALLEKDPADRFGTMSDLRKAILAILSPMGAK